MSAVSHQDREIRAARNQALLRAVNEKIRAINESFGVLTGMYTVACECSRPDCVEMVDISVEAYEAVRASPYTFVVRIDHVEDAVENVVAAHNGYVVVEMAGEAARPILEETAPTSGAGEQNEV